jgi:hypothetical protein
MAAALGYGERKRAEKPVVVTTTRLTSAAEAEAGKENENAGAVARADASCGGVFVTSILSNPQSSQRKPVLVLPKKRTAAIATAATATSTTTASATASALTVLRVAVPADAARLWRIANVMSGGVFEY